MSSTAQPVKADGAKQAGDAKLAALRKLMTEADGGRGVHAYIVPTEDPHMSEYPPDWQARREFISGFTGSAGTALVTTDAAMLWTDGRYWLQGDKQLGPEWTLMRAGHPTVPEIPDWLAEHLPAGGRVGIDPYLHTVDAARKLASALEAGGHSLVPLLGGNLVDAVWGDAQPSDPGQPVRVHALEWAGASVADKLASMRGEMKAAGAGALVATMLDEVAWLFNLRGKDVSFNPVFISYGLVTTDSASLFVDPAKVTPDTAAHLSEAGVAVKPYDAISAEVQALARAGVTMWVDPSKASIGLCEVAKQAVEGAAGANGDEPIAGSRGKRRKSAGPGETNAAAAAKPAKLFLERASPVYAAKAVKNETELAGMREAHLRDGAALAGFLCWLEAKVAGQGSGPPITECDVDERLNAARAEQQGFVEPSFPTIAGANANGAIIHYRPEPATCGAVDSASLLLLDSGGQYDCGTTDITRCFHFGEPSAHQRACYTRVLQGHIALDSAVFPEGTPGLALDTLARMHLWRAGLNYRHGTGHGVGAALNVHEGPQSISTRYAITTPLQAGMIVSNEPGYYEDGAFGIRIENLVSIAEADTEFRFGGQPYFHFQPLTMCPISTKLMDREMMTDAEVEWVDKYHRTVWDAISPRVTGDALEWLRTNTQPLKAAA